MVACIAGIPVCFRQSFLGEKEWGKQKAAAGEEGLKNGEGEGGQHFVHHKRITGNAG